MSQGPLLTLESGGASSNFLLRLLGVLAWWWDRGAASFPQPSPSNM